MQTDFIIKNCAEIATPLANGGFKPAALKIIKNGALAACEGEIVFVGKTAELDSQVEIREGVEIIDASGKIVTPGFVDSHTHPIFGDTRENEFEMRISGKSYEEIALAGGGIRSSVRSLRHTSKEELVEKGPDRCSHAHRSHISRCFSHKLWELIRVFGSRNKS